MYKRQIEHSALRLKRIIHLETEHRQTNVCPMDVLFTSHILIWDPLTLFNTITWKQNNWIKAEGVIRKTKEHDSILTSHESVMSLSCHNRSVASSCGLFTNIERQENKRQSINLFSMMFSRCLHCYWDWCEKTRWDKNVTWFQRTTNIFFPIGHCLLHILSRSLTKKQYI